MKWNVYHTIHVHACTRIHACMLTYICACIFQLFLVLCELLVCFHACMQDKVPGGSLKFFYAKQDDDDSHGGFNVVLVTESEMKIGFYSAKGTQLYVHSKRTHVYRACNFSVVF